MFTIAQIKQLKSGLVIDEVRGILTEVKEHKTVPTARGPATVQNFQLNDPVTKDWIKGAIWDHADLSGLVGYEIILISVKGGNNRFGGVKVEDKQDVNDPTKIYKNLSVGNVGVVHTPETYAAIPRTAAPVPAPSAVPAPAAAAAPPAETAAAAPRQAPVPVPARAEGVSNAPRAAAPAPQPAATPAAVPAPSGRPAGATATHEALVEYHSLCFAAAARTIDGYLSPGQNSEGKLQAVVAATAQIFIAGVDLGFHKKISRPGEINPGDKVPF